MDKHLCWAWAIKNSVCIICWVALAIIFSKWWIAIFAIFFMSDIKTSNERHYRKCDGCGKYSPVAKDHDEALDKAKKAGWTHIVSENKDFCPDCYRKILNEQIGDEHK